MTNYATFGSMRHLLACLARDFWPVEAHSFIWMRRFTPAPHRHKRHQRELLEETP